MPKLTEYTSYADAQAHANSAALWELFDGDREHLNIAHECITRHADGSGRAAVRIAHADGSDEILSFDTLLRGRSPHAGETWYQDIHSDAAGDGTIPTYGAAGQFFGDARSSLTQQLLCGLTFYSVVRTQRFKQLLI